jgi:hypothetical protein
MGYGVDFMRSIGKETAVLLLSSLLVISGTGCGKKDGDSSHAPPAGPVASTGGASDAKEGKGGAGSSADGYSASIVPSSPSRITLPSISVKLPPGKEAEVSEVQWLVNGTGVWKGQTLPADRFRRGDKIQAIVKIHTPPGERSYSTSEVVAINALPAVVLARIEPKAPTTGSMVRVIAEGRDPDGDPVAFGYKWFVDDAVVPGDADSFLLKGVKKGSWVHAAVASNDGFADGAWRYSSRHQVANAPPVVKNPPPSEVPPSRLLKHTIVAEDPDGDPLTYVLEKSPPGVALDGSTLTWQVPPDFLGKNALIVVLISDNDGGSTRVTFNLTIREK